MKRLAFLILLIGLLLSGTAADQGRLNATEQLTAEQIMEKSQLAFYYAGDDMKSRVTMQLVSQGGGAQTRVMTMLRLDQNDGGDQKYFMYFHEPGDVRRMTFMVWKYSEAEDDRWIYVPAVDLVRRIAANDKYSSFVGSDFNYEDISGRDLASDTHTLLRSENINGNLCYLVQSIPGESAPYSKRLSWINTADFLPMKEEYYDAQEDLYKVFTVETVEGVTTGTATYPTVMARTMSNVKTGHRTVVIFDDVQYDLGLEDSDFSERFMRQPPRDWIN